MILDSLILPDSTGNAELTVGEEHTAPRVGSGRVRVLATPVLINLFEAAALAAIEHKLPKGYQSLGTVLNVRHFAATPVGMKVLAIATVMRVEKRTVVFHLQAMDEKESICEGDHERVVVNVEKFSLRVKAKEGK